MAQAQKSTTAPQPLSKVVNQFIMKNDSKKYHKESIIYRFNYVPTMFAEKCMPLIFYWYFSFVQKVMLLSWYVIFFAR